MKSLSLLAGAALVASALSSNASTLDFSAVQGFQNSPLVLSNATLTSLSGGRILVGPSAALQEDGFCFFSESNNTCESDGRIAFGGPVSNLLFDVDGWDPGDFIAISAYLGATFLGTLNAVANATLDFSGFGALDRLDFDDSSIGAGAGFSTFRFTEGGVGVIPLPPALPLLAAGLLVLGVIGRRRAA